MSKRGHTEEQILRALHQAEGGTRISDLCREHGISEATSSFGSPQGSADVTCGASIHLNLNAV